MAGFQHAVSASGVGDGFGIEVDADSFRHGLQGGRARVIPHGLLAWPRLHSVLPHRSRAHTQSDTPWSRGKRSPSNWSPSNCGRQGESGEWSCSCCHGCLKTRIVPFALVPRSGMLKLCMGKMMGLNLDTRIVLNK